MRICYIFQDEYPWDIRAEKFTDTLADAGHEVVILSRNRNRRPRSERLRPGVQVVRLPIGLTPVDRTIMNFPAFFSPWWLNAIIRTIREHRIDLILVRDLPLAPAAVWAGRITRRRVIMDMAENYPAMLQATWDTGAHKPWDYLVRNPAFLRRLERWIVPKLDGVFVVSEANKQRVAELTAGRVPIWIVENTPRLTTADASVPSALAEKIRNHPGLTLIYVGFLDAKRGLDIVVRALPFLKKSEPNVLAVIVGRGGLEPILRKLAEELDVQNNVLMPGWVDQREVPSIIAAADIGLIPHMLTEHTDTTIPNKIYDYMAQGKPVVVTQCRTLRRIVDSAGCGRVYQDTDPEEFARVVLSLRDENVRHQLGESGRRAIESRYHWAYDAKTLLSAIAEFAPSPSSASVSPSEAR